jgi:glycosyltransferase involved in cell wall biosynthesis
VSDVTDVWPEALINTGYSKPDSVFYKGAKFLARVAYKISDQITTLTPHMVDMFQKRYEISPNRVKMIPNIGKEGSNGYSPDLSKIQGKFTVLYYGNLGTNYDFSPVLEIIGKMRGEPVNFVIKASGGEWLPKIQKRKREASLDNLEIMTKSMSEAELKDLVASANALILAMGKHPFPDASFPIKFVEYLGMCKPIIFIGKGYSRELIEKYRLGLAVDWTETDRVVEFIRTLESNSKLCDEMGARANKISSEMFSEPIFKKSLEYFLMLQEPI